MVVHSMSLVYPAPQLFRRWQTDMELFIRASRVAGVRAPPAFLRLFARKSCSFTSKAKASRGPKMLRQDHYLRLFVFLTIFVLVVAAVINTDLLHDHHFAQPVFAIEQKSMQQASLVQSQNTKHLRTERTGQGTRSATSAASNSKARSTISSDASTATSASMLEQDAAATGTSTTAQQDEDVTQLVGQDRPEDEDSGKEIISGQRTYERENTPTYEPSSIRPPIDYDRFHSYGQQVYIPDGTASEEEVANHQLRHKRMLFQLQMAEQLGMKEEDMNSTGDRNNTDRKKFKLPSVGNVDARQTQRKPYNLAKASLPWSGYIKFSDVQTGQQHDLCLGYVEDANIYLGAKQAQSQLGDFDEVNILTWGSCPTAKWSLIPQMFPTYDGRYLFNIEWNHTGLFLASSRCEPPVGSNLLSLAAYLTNETIGAGKNIASLMGDSDTSAEQNAGASNSTTDGGSSASSSAGAASLSVEEQQQLAKKLLHSCFQSFPKGTYPILLSRTSPTLFQLKWDGTSFHPRMFELQTAYEEVPDPDKSNVNVHLALDETNRMVRHRSQTGGTEQLKVALFPPIYCEWANDTLCTYEEVNDWQYEKKFAKKGLLVLLTNQVKEYVSIVLFHPYSYLFTFFYAIVLVALYFCCKGARFLVNRHYAPGAVNPKSGGTVAQLAHERYQLQLSDMAFGVRAHPLDTPSTSRFTHRNNEKAIEDQEALDAALPAPDRSTRSIGGNVARVGSVTVTGSTSSANEQDNANEQSRNSGTSRASRRSSKSKRNFAELNLEETAALLGEDDASPERNSVSRKGKGKGKKGT
ncbi:unnamed protein product [Amoebophrya sp. A120]|nr:unnamed protein product [Amoebophrya sp. A120]|eukprot:GSA120T00013182001.1